MKIDIYFDGACNNHLSLPPMGIGVAVFVNDNYEEELSYDKHYVGEGEWGIGTNNVAEWLGCIEACRTAYLMLEVVPDAKVRIFSDSQIIVNQFNGSYRIKDPKFHALKEESSKWGKGFIKTIHWVPREKNRQADKLSKIGIKKGYDKLPIDSKDLQSRKSSTSKTVRRTKAA